MLGDSQTNQRQHDEEPQIQTATTQSKVTSSLVLSKTIVQLERTPRTTKL